MSNNDVQVVNITLTIFKDVTFDELFVLKDDADVEIDLTGYSAKMQIKNCGGSDPVLFELSNVNGRIILNSSPGEIQLKINDTDTGAIAFDKGVYDLILTDPSGDTELVLRGDVIVKDSITK